MTWDATDRVWKARIPIRTVSELNQREHWAKKHRRRSSQRAIVAMIVRAATRRVALPIAVTLTRIAPRKLDAFDNLPSALKACVDGIADAFGIRDDDPRIAIAPAMQRAEGSAYAVEITIAATPTM